ncbi:MAG TPA: PD-(D/E)XK nuclease family protein, partial [Thermoanaerobaculia bacterium]
VSPTQLEDFGECPQKFLFKHLLGVYDIDDPEREVQIHHREKGTLDHRILERFYRDLDSETIAAAAAALPRLDEALATRLESFIDVAFDEFEEEYPPFNRAVRDIERRATKRILRNFLVADLGELAAAGLVPRHFEYRFGPKYAERGNVAHPESFTVEAEGVTIRVDGSIDRIDSDGEHFRIVDYKSGKALRHKELAKKIDRGVRMQLALYAMAVARFFGVEAAQVAGAIKPLVVSADVKATTFAFALAEKEGALVETIALFIRSMLAGRFPAFPNERDDDFNSCKYCPVNHSCRTKHDVDERYAVQAHRDPRTLLSESR